MTNLKDLFPNTKHKFGTHAQMMRVLDELVEAEIDLKADNRELFLYEMVDVLHAAAGVLYKSHYKFSDDEIQKAIYTVQDKNRRRGYYE